MRLPSTTTQHNYVWSARCCFLRYTRTYKFPQCARSPLCWRLACRSVAERCLKGCYDFRSNITTTGCLFLRALASDKKTYMHFRELQGFVFRRVTFTVSSEFRVSFLLWGGCVFLVSLRGSHLFVVCSLMLPSVYADVQVCARTRDIYLDRHDT